MDTKAYSQKRLETRNRIDSVYIENFRASGDADMTVKEICEKAGINRSTFYTYYNDTVDMRKQIEARLIARFEKRITPVYERYPDEPDRIMLEILEYNRENGHLPLLLVTAGSSSFVYGISRAVTDLFEGSDELPDDIREKITILFTYHFAGISMVMRQMRGSSVPSDEDYENMAGKLVELILPVVKNGILPTVKGLY